MEVKANPGELATGFSAKFVDVGMRKMYIVDSESSLSQPSETSQSTQTRRSGTMFCVMLLQ